MKTLAIAVASILTAVATPAFAQVYYERSYAYDPYWAARADVGRSECWNPRAGHFESVRPGERQDDLDFSRCRIVGQRWVDRSDWRSTREQCWNPRAGHFEDVRLGERQDDLDFFRCRVVRGDRVAYERYYERYR